MTKPIQLASQPTPTSTPTPRLRPTQATPVRRESVQAGGDDPRGGGGCMFGITPCQPIPDSIVFVQPPPVTWW